MKFMKSKTYFHLGTILWITAAALALLPSWPYLYYRLSPKASDALASTLAQTTSSSPSDQPTNRLTDSPTQPITPSPSVDSPDSPQGVPTQPTPPPLDLSLPTQNGLIIDKIGIRGQIHEGEDWESILKQGIWRVPNFSTPADLTDSQQGALTQPLPIILAAHRWGYLDWSNGFRKLNSFYNLPKLAVGDKIEIVWEQRQYEYEVYSVQTGTEIPEYKANLILYTCQLWNSPVRFFVLANRTN